MKVPIKIVVILSLTLFSFSSIFTNTNWKLVKDKQGIKVFTKERKGRDIKALKMHSDISGQSLSSFVALFQDLDSYQEWVYSSSETKLLKKITEQEILYYIRSDFPWPMSDRDFVVKNKIWQDSETLSFYSQSEIFNNYLDEYHDCVRVKEFTATWKITPLSNGDFRLNYTFDSDPGGHVPSWLVNSFLDVGPFKTIKGMEKAAKHKKYKHKKFTFIKELEV